MLREAESLGSDSVWTAEAYGSDALVPLTWWGAATEHIKLGTAIMQMSARTPAATAMAAMTLDHLSGGRLILGLGVSGPQVVEGWYGQSFAKPLARTREYIGILRQIWERQGRVTNEGPHYPLPYQGGNGLPESTGLRKPLKSNIHPLRETIPIYLAGKKDEAAAAIPVKLIEELTLIGSTEKLRAELEAWRESAVTTLLISVDPAMMGDAAELVLG